jgi:hypothetical protein
VTNNTITDANTSGSATRAFISVGGDDWQIFGNRGWNATDAGLAQYAIYNLGHARMAQRDNAFAGARVLDLFTSNVLDMQPRHDSIYASSGNSVTVDAGATVDGGADEKTLKTVTYAAGYFTGYGGAHIRASGSTAGSTTSVIRLYFGASIITAPTVFAADTWMIEADVYMAGGEGVERVISRFVKNGSFASPSNWGEALLNENTVAAPVTIKLTGASLTDTVTATIFSVEVFR